MAANVFGTPITNETLKSMAEYENKTITRTDRAHVALNMKNAQGKDADAQTYVENLDKEYGSGITTLCLVYNATGDMIQLVEQHNWAGDMWKAPCAQIIGNGQWGAFLQGEKHSEGSSAAVVYRGKRVDDQDADWMFSWYNPHTGANYSYTEIREVDHYANNAYWDYIHGLVTIAQPSSRDAWNGCLSMVSIARANGALLQAVLTQEDA
ncbi:hypothetical protein CFOL_v3_34948 [Cephalotus follicularis]|uniref:23 kDa jasmonate-induced protein-like n=1 Tax=Cephalotus follicularis TaxID=3775 RepID=A0A1Q3DGE5_CEPFO|nr:hypothetical protein CFOL_v3_34948 [Cephalotus follicularis]